MVEHADSVFFTTQTEASVSPSAVSACAVHGAVFGGEANNPRQGLVFTGEREPQTHWHKKEVEAARLMTTS